MHLPAPEGAREAEPEQPGVPKSVDHRLGQTTIRLALLGVLRGQRREIPRSGERIGRGHPGTVPVARA